MNYSGGRNLYLSGKSHMIVQYIDLCLHPHASQGEVLGRGVSPLPTEYDRHGDAH